MSVAVQRGSSRLAGAAGAPARRGAPLAGRLGALLIEGVQAASRVLLRCASGRGGDAAPRRRAGWLHAVGLLLAVMTMAAQAAPEQRIALVIGNGRYAGAALANPANDARAIGKALGEAGFKVTVLENAGIKDMNQAIREFGDALARGGGVGLFFFAGHGVQVKGRNYLIPVDSGVQREDEVPYASIDTNLVLDKMETAANRVNILILDACRNNPFARSLRAAGGGLVQMDAPAGTLIAFSTAPGSVASDGEGQNSVYTQFLLQAMRVPGARIEDVFKSVRTQVRQSTGGKQIPWENTALEGDFVFFPKAPEAVARQIGQPAPGQAPVIREIAAPQLKVGDSYRAQLIDLFSGSVVKTYTKRVVAADRHGWRFADGSEYDRSFNLLRETQDGKPTVEWQPARPNYAFPLTPGKAWRAAGVRTWEEGRSEVTVDFKAVRQERVLVPAGIFDTLRVEGTGGYKSTVGGASGSGTVTHRYWIAADSGLAVAYEYEETNWKGKLAKKQRTELLSFKPAGQ
ncbi:MAG: caspase family protein [Rhodocyclaceae bacterium]|nr:caspase family protein [Rhodocyclaceae bacterium]